MGRLADTQAEYIWPERHGIYTYGRLQMDRLTGGQSRMVDGQVGSLGGELDGRLAGWQVGRLAGWQTASRQCLVDQIYIE